MPFDDGPQTKGDEAALITDKSGVAILVNMFDGNDKAVSHACGHHWRMTFVQRSGPPVNIYFNEKCEQFVRNTAEICATMQALFREIRTAPKAFITNVGIAPGTAPDEAMRRLAAMPGYRVFQLTDPDSRFPFIEIQAVATVGRPQDKTLPQKTTEEAHEKARNMLGRDIARIKEKYAIEKTGEFDWAGGSFDPYRIETNERVRVLFPVGTDIGAVEACLVESKLIEKKVPEVYYLQVVGREGFPVSAKALRAGTDNFFKTISAYGF
jgi:hypothetical protein